MSTTVIKFPDGTVSIISRNPPGRAKLFYQAFVHLYDIYARKHAPGHPVWREASNYRRLANV